MRKKNANALIIIILLIGTSLLGFLYRIVFLEKHTIKNNNTIEDNISDDQDNDTIQDNIDIEQDNNVASCETLHKAIEYNVIFDIVAPEGFVESDSSRLKYGGKEYSRYEYYYNKREDGGGIALGSCYFELQQLVSNYNSEGYAKSIKDCFTSAKINQVNINNINWYVVEYNFSGETYSYITEKDGIVYEFKYRIFDKNDYGFCKASLDLTLKSIKFK